METAESFITKGYRITGKELKEKLGLKGCIVQIKYVELGPLNKTQSSYWNIETRETITEPDISDLPIKGICIGCGTVVHFDPCPHCGSNIKSDGNYD